MSTKRRKLRDGESQEPERNDASHEHGLDKTIEDSFPASDPPSSIPDPDEDAA